MTPSRSIRQWVILLILLQFPVFAQQPEDRYTARRQQIMAEMDGGVAILFSETSDGGANTHFDYLTGVRDPGSTLLLVPGGNVTELLFCPSGQWKPQKPANQPKSLHLTSWAGIYRHCCVRQMSPTSLSGT